MLRTVRDDLRLAAGSLRRTPGLTISAIATLAVALGASIAIFTVVNATMLRPPPYEDPERLLVYSVTGGGPTTPRELTFLRERSRAFAAITGQWTSPGWNLVAGNRAEFVEGLQVADDYFETYGVPLLLGRGISRAEAQPGGPLAVVLNEELWRRVFDSRRDVLGTIVELGGRPHEVVGVVPSRFRTIPAAQVWTPIQSDPQSNAGGIRIVGRLGSGATHVDALTELEAMRGELRTVLGDQGERAAIVMWRTYQDWFAARSRELMVLLVAAVGALLLIACVNVGGLQVARGLGRTREFAVRAALGATRARLFRETFAESILLAAIASTIGLALAMSGTQALLSLLTQDVAADILAGQPVAIDFRVILAALSAGAAAAVLAGLAPAVASANVDLRNAAGDAIRATAGRRDIWLRRGFAVGQIAVALVLLVGAGLSVRTFALVRGAELGFEPDGITIGEMAIQGDQWDAASRNLFLEQTLARIREIGGVAAVAITSAVPVDRPANAAVQAQGADALLPDRHNVDFAYATPEYFDLFSIPLRVGRLFDRSDDFGAAPVAVVNASFARTFFGRENVMGESIRVLGYAEPVRQIVGIVGDVRSRSGSEFAGEGLTALSNPPSPMIYVPLRQLSAGGFRSLHQFTPMRWVMKTHAGAAGIPEAVQEAVRLQDPRRPFRRFVAMEQIIGRDLAVHRFLAALLTIFSTIALSLAALGVYALMAHRVAQRRREVGIRITLGATTPRLLRMFLGESARLTAAGLLIGLIAAPYLTRTMAMFLVGVTPVDPATFVIVPTALLVTALLAAFIPARHAARLDPAMSLRSE
jgi:predicted permease